MGHKSAFYAYVFPLTFTFYIHLWLSSLEMVILAGVCSLRVHLCKSSFNFHFLHPLSKFYFHLFFQFGNGHSGTSLLSTLTSSPSSSSPSTTSPSPAQSIPLWESPMKGRNLDKHSKNSFVHFQYCMLQQNRIEKRIFWTTWQSRVHFASLLSLLAAKSLSRKWDKHPFWKRRGFSDFTSFDLKIFISICLHLCPKILLHLCKIESVSRIWLYLCKNVIILRKDTWYFCEQMPLHFGKEKS